MVITVGNNILNCNFFKILLLPSRLHVIYGTINTKNTLTAYLLLSFTNSVFSHKRITNIILYKMVKNRNFCHNKGLHVGLLR